MLYACSTPSPRSAVARFHRGKLEGGGDECAVARILSAIRGQLRSNWDVVESAIRQKWTCPPRPLFFFREKVVQRTAFL